MRARPFLALVLLAPGLCLAQTTQTFPISILGGYNLNGVVRFGPANCGQLFVVQWGIPTPAQITQICAVPEFWITAGFCGDHPNDHPGGASDIVLTPNSPLDLSSRSGTFNAVGVNDLPIFHTTDGGGTCGSYANNTTLYVCGSVPVPSSGLGCGTTTPFHASNPPIQYRGLPPPGPTSFDVAALDSALKVNVSASPTEVAIIHVEMREAGVGDFAEVATFSPVVGNTKISNLQNGTAYEVRVYDDDGVGNYSDRTAVITATPVASDGFYETYRRLGGEDTGGCGSALPGALGVPLVLGVYRLLRRKR